MEELLNRLQSLNITLSENNDQIDVFDPDENLSQQIITEIKDHKSDILHYLKSLENASETQYIPQAPKKEYYPLSPSQKRMFFLYEIDKTSLSYNMPQIYKVKGNLDVDQLESIFNELISRHEILRTNFEVIEGESVQKIQEKTTLKVARYQSSEEEIEAVVKDFIAPFDLSKDCLLRIGVVELKDHRVLMIDMHHIIGDAMSHGILVNELKILYEGGTLEPLQLQYKDYVEWQKGEEYQKTIEEDRRFWLDKFNDEITPLELPTDFKRPAIKTNEGAIHGFSINAEETEQLKAIGRSQGTSLFVTILGIYKILLYKLTNQTDITIGVPTRGRDHVALENMLGMFVNTVALRNDLRTDEAFIEALAKMRDNVLNSFDHQAFQYDKLVEELGIKRSTNRSPIFDIAFSFDSFGDTDTTIADLEFEPYERELKNAKFDLTLIASESGDGVNFIFEYSTHLFKEQTIKRFGEYFKRIIKQVIDNKNLKINEITVISESEKNLILNTFNPSKRETENNTTLLETFESQVAKSPDNIALVFKGTTLTYADLDKRSSQFANYLLDQGVKNEQLIPICLDRSIEMVIGILGILKSGAAFVTIDPYYPQERISYILEDTGAKLIVTETSLESTFSSALEKICMDTFEGYDDYAHTYNASNIQPDHLGYIIYTSGTTGRPKGVMCKHDGMLNMALSSIEVMELAPDDNVLQFASFAFDAFVFELFTTLLSGAKLAIPEKQVINSIEEVAGFIREEQITVATIPPSYQAILRENIFNMKVVVSAGEPLNAEITKSLTEKGLKVINAYGPTENSVCTSMSTDPILENEMVTIGKPIRGVNVYILNEDEQLCPIGVTGELCVSGVQVARGYLNRPEITKVKFIEKSFEEGTLTSLYKTGDLARWLSDGNIEFIGRKDNQVKLRGYRIELEEIESTMCKIPEISGSAVIHNKEQQSLTAYYTAKPKAALDMAFIKEQLSTFLPEYMVPSNYIKIDKIPLTSNGKVDKKALSAIETKHEIKKPEKAIEKELIDLWAEVLKIDKDIIGVDSDFFVLGGHSLMAISMVHDLNEQFTTAIQLEEIFETSILSELAELILQRQDTGKVLIPKAEDKEYYALSSAQKRLYFMYELDKSSIMYNAPQFYTIKGKLDLILLEQVFRKIVERHEALRTNFEVVDGMAMQTIKDAEGFTIQYGQGTEKDIDSEIDEFIKPYALHADYPFRVKLVTLGTDEYFLLIDMHHIVSDGLSYEILLRDFWNLYNNEQLEPLPLQYKDYAEWQQSDAQKERVKEHRAFWMEQYQNPLTPLELPTNYPRPAKKSGKGGSVGFTLGTEETSKLKEIAQGEGATMFMVLLAVYNTFLNKLSNQEDIVVGVSSSGRPNSDFDNVVGIFLNSIPLRNTVNGDLTFREFLREIKSNTLNCFNHQLFQYEELVEALQVGRNMNRNPLFDAILVYKEETIKGEFQNVELDISTVKREHEYSKFDLALFAIGGEENLKLQFTYASDLFNEERIHKFIAYFKKILTQIIENSETKLAEVKILSEEEQNRIASGFNAKDNQEEAFGVSAVAMFEEMVAEDPENEAVCYNDTILTYEELNEEANKLARRLIDAHDIGKGDIVAIKMQRSEKLIISMLGVLKTGAAYLPIDYYMPEQRMAYIVSDSMAKCVISDQSMETETQNISWEESEQWALNNTDNLDKKIAVEDSVYVIYTSGTTGKPKGVCIPNRSLCNYVNWLTSSYNIDFRDRTALFSSHAYDLCYTSLWGSILSGGTLHIINDSKHFDPIDVASCILENGISFIKLTPSHLKLLYKSAEFVENIKRTSLRLILLGGESIDLNDVAFFLERKRSVQFVNHYGPTETTIGAIAHNIDKKGVFDAENVIGKGIDNNEIFILDKNLALVPIGAKGEICIAGSGVSNGYLNNAELTTEKFIANPYATGDHDTVLYKTGDLARFREDGNIEFLGRLDDQVKIRGHRIELKEVEMHLNSLDAINESTVLVKENQLGENQLVAYVITAGDRLNEEHVITEMSLNLPDYMVPKRYVQLETFPLTLNGKVDKKALPEINVPEVKSTILEEEGSYNEVQKKLLDLWSDILRLDKEAIGLNNDFFNLGGHSLLAIEMIYKMSELFSVEVPIDVIFEKKTIFELAEHIDELDEKTFINIPKAEEREYYPLSPAQRRLYFVYEFDKTSHAYNMPGIYRINAEVDVEHIENIFRSLVKQHESLRTNFITIDDEIVQKVGGWDTFEIEYSHAKEAQVREIIKEFVRPFDLSKEHPFRVGLIQLQEGGYILMTDKHHIISDGLSQEVLLKDFWTLYQGNTLEPLQLQYKDYAVWQENMDQVELLEKHKAYWLQKFEKELVNLDLNTDFERPRVKTSNGASILFDIDPEKGERLKQLAEEKGVTLFMLFLSLYNVLLNKLSTSKDIVVGVPVSGRYHVDLEGIVGMFVNTLPLRNQSEGALLFTKFLDNVKENCLGAFDNYLYQYDNLVEELDIRRDVSRNPLFDVLFSYDKKVKLENDADHSDEIVPYELEKDIVKFDLHMAITDMDGQLHYGLSYNTDLFKKETIAQYAHYFDTLIDQVLNNPKIKLSELTILSPVEHDRIVSQFNDRDDDTDLTKTLGGLFSEQVQKTPNNIALKYHDVEVTYAELETRANALVNHLVAQGISKGDIIGIHMDRSIEMIIAILAILKAGCSYVPMNPSQPIARTKYMIADGNIKLVITSRTHEELLSTDLKVVEVNALNWEGLSNEPLPLQVDSDSLAYIIYTSGSTGKPKGVGVKHKGVVNLIRNQQQAFGIDHSDRILQFSPIHFDASVEQVWLSLLSGCALVLIDETTLLDQQHLNAYITAQGVTHFHATPSFLEILVLEENNDLRRIVAGGEPCKPSLATKFEGYDFYNKYGPTEATVTATMHKVDKVVQNKASIPIGTPIANMKAYVLNEYMKVVPVGVVGELYLSGAGLSLGYINAPELTEKSFINNPFSNDPNAQLYKTGDLVRWLPDGNLEFLGRIDHQVKVRGYRIELGEIETELQSLETIKQAVVELKETASGDKQLVGYLITDEGTDPSMIKDQLKEHLPEYMIPQSYVKLEAFPMTPSGKVDRKALPAPEVVITTYVPPSTAVEEQLVNIWATILEIDEQKIGVTQNFFEIGGHSLKAINLTNKINEAFSVEIPLKEIFQRNTILGIAEVINNHSWLNEDKANQENEEFGIII